MRIRLGNGLVPINVLVWVLIASMLFFPYSVLRIILGIPYVVFFPGYALVLALFPKREGIGAIARVALSFGISIGVVVMNGLVVNYTPWSIELESILYPIAFFTLIASIIAWVRSRRLQEGERFGIDFQFRPSIVGEGAWSKALSIAVIVAIVGALGMLGYTLVKPKVGERFTEFYILGPDGKAKDYPEELSVGEEGRVIVGIINKEQGTVSYQIEVRIDQVKNIEIGPIVLEHDEQWSEMIGFTPDRPGDNQKVCFFLYKNGVAEPYLEPLQLWVDVKG